MSEGTAYTRYVEHIGSCKACRPATGVLCDEGFALHVAWRALCIQQPAPPRKTVSAAGRPRTRLRVGR